MRRAILAIVVTITGLVLLLSFKPHEITAATDRPAAVSTPGSGDSGSAGVDDDDEGDGDDDTQNGRGGPPGGGGAKSESSGARTGGGTSAGATAGDKTITGSVADTRWGPVQVQLVISGGKVTGITVLQAPNGNHRDIEINNRALPVLNEAALAAQSADIDTVSGATYTSDGYRQSLQSALDQAGL